MREPAVADVMTRQVITVVPDTSFRELVGTMLAHELDSVPVIDLAGRPIGVVTDVDALTKLEYHGGDDFLPLLAGARCRARWRKSSGLTATDLMTTPAPVTTAAAPLSTALHALAEGTGRLYVVDRAGLLTGSVTRRDAMRLLLRSDHAIQADIEHLARAPGAGAGQVAVEVAAGVVTLRGRLRLRSTAERIWRCAHCVPGVITVRDDLRYDIDDFLITGM